VLIESSTKSKVAVASCLGTHRSGHIKFRKDVTHLLFGIWQFAILRHAAVNAPRAILFTEVDWHTRPTV
jgi:hypothetical protein